MSERTARDIGIVLLLLAVVAGYVSIVLPVSRAVQGKPYVLFREIAAYTFMGLFFGTFFLVYRARAVAFIDQFTKPSILPLALIAAIVLGSFILSFTPEYLIAILTGP